MLATPGTTEVHVYMGEAFTDTHGTADVHICRGAAFTDNVA